MLKHRILPFLISSIICTLALASDENLDRTKRQAPSINVHQIPKTSFSCVDKKVGDYYADPETNCQVYHVCIPGMHNKLSLMSFVCPNGTIFSQATRVCTPYERVDCRLALKFYDNLHGSANDKRPIYETDNEFDNYVPQPQPAPREPVQPVRQPSRGRTTTTPPPPPSRDLGAQPPRNTRFRIGGNQFRGQQAPPTTTVAPVRTTTSAPAPVRVAVRPAPPAFRPPVLGGRPSQIGAVSNVLPPRPTPRATISTSTSSYNYEYEYEYDYEDEIPAVDQVNARSKREAATAEDYDSEAFERKSSKTSFTCEDKVAGGVYADVESDCEMFHICVPMGKYKMLDYKVFCANGTGFDQETGSCREKEEFNCENAFLFYQFQKPHQPTSSKKPILSKKMYAKSKKVIRAGKE
ncbi:uncharacterized protein LOC129218118 [Uloborus diversus]|uniref:uncharacterized protein LOC129218118 n=1 Tax=Uloborus diversus TaxID=327109 RepID=UPI0024098207|nr:uncharacterized protein LOC129218118 [Uloborus diversus]